MNKRNFRRVTVTLSAPLVDRLDRMRAAHRMSVSIIIENAIEHCLVGDSHDVFADKLTTNGPSLRRTTK